jgi:hypothetical protein
MLRTTLLFGLIAGLITDLNFAVVLALGDPLGHGLVSAIYGYLVMILALSLIFVGVKRLRDHAYGGVIRFGQALLVGLGVSAFAGLFYVIGWEITLAATHYTFADTYAAATLHAAQARGASAAELERITTQMQGFKVQYANPLYRAPMTFVEIFPVGLVISLIAAGVLRNSRFLPARAAVG